MAPERLTQRASGLILQKQNPGRAGIKLTLERLPKAICQTSPTVLFQKKCKRVVEREIFAEIKGGKKSYFCSEGKGSILKGIFLNCLLQKEKHFTGSNLHTPPRNSHGSLGRLSRLPIAQLANIQIVTPNMLMRLPGCSHHVTPPSFLCVNFGTCAG